MLWNTNSTARLRAGSNRQRGFTMVELMMVVLIAVIMMAFAIPAVNGALGNYRLHNSVASVTWAIQSARYQALMEGYPFQVAFNASNNTYQILSEVPPAVTFSNVGNSVPITSTAMVMNQNTTIQFTPMGYVTAPTGSLNNFTITAWGNTATIVVTNYGNITVTYGNHVYQ